MVIVAKTHHCSSMLYPIYTPFAYIFAPVCIFMGFELKDKDCVYDISTNCHQDYRGFILNTKLSLLRK